MSQLAEEVGALVKAGFPGLWLETSEVDEAERELLELCTASGWDCALWSLTRGIWWPNPQAGNPLKTNPEQVVGEEPGGLRIRSVQADRSRRLVVCLEHFHRYLEHPGVIQGLFHALVRGKAEKITWVVLGPGGVIPPELSTLFTTVEHLPPDEQQLSEIAAGLLEDGEAVPPGVARAARGLSRREAENAFALGLVKHGQLDADTVWGLKKTTVDRLGFMNLHRGGPGFASLGGLEGLKAFARRLLRTNATRRASPKGLLLVGPPGTGKSAFAKALGSEVGWPTLSLDLGAVYDKYVGTSEANIRKALATADAMGDVVLFLDELDKSIAGSQGEGDSGVAARAFGTLLTWLSDREERGSRAFVVATANEPDRLTGPSGGALVRAERFDAMFMIDFPTNQERDGIWQLYRDQYGIPAGGQMESVLGDESWSGAEVKACCRLSALLDVPLFQAARHVVPVAVTAAEQIKKLREWASGRCLSATTGEAYRAVQGSPPVVGGEGSGGRRRQVEGGGG